VHLDLITPVPFADSASSKPVIQGAKMNATGEIDLAVWHDGITMTVNIIQCQNLPEVKSQSYRHFYVQTWLNTDDPISRKVTQVVTGSLNPEFNDKICVSW